MLHICPDRLLKNACDMHELTYRTYCVGVPSRFVAKEMNGTRVKTVTEMRPNECPRIWVYYKITDKNNRTATLQTIR